MALMKGVNVRVLSFNADMEFPISSLTTGKFLIDQVFQVSGLREIWYFGLQYTDRKSGVSWLKQEKKVKDQPVKKEEPLQFK